MGDLYNRIEKLCADRNVNMTIMCRESGASRASLTDLKRGRKQGLAAETLSKIANYFNVSVDYLIGNETRKAPEETDALADVLQEFRDSPDLRTLFSLSKNATEEELRQYINVIKALRGTDE